MHGVRALGLHELQEFLQGAVVAVQESIKLLEHPGGGAGGGHHLHQVELRACPGVIVQQALFLLLGDAEDAVADGCRFGEADGFETFPEVLQLAVDCFRLDISLLEML